MHIIGIIMLILTFVLFYKAKNIKNITKYTIVFMFVSYFFFNIGFIFKIGNKELLYFQFYLYLFYILNIGLYIRNPFNRKEKIFIIIFGCIIVINNLLLFLHPTSVDAAVYPNTWHQFLVEGKPQTFLVNKYTLFYDVYIFMIPVSLINMKKNFDKKDFKDILNSMFKVGIFLFLYSTFEFIFNLFFDPQILINIRNFLFGITDHTVITSIERNGMPVIMGLLREPSTFAYGVFIVQILSTVFCEKKKSFLIFIWGSCLGFLSGSFSYIVLFILAALVFILVNYMDIIKANYKKILIVFSVSVVVLIAILPQMEFFQYYLDRIINIKNIFFETFDEYTSEYERITSAFINFKVFISRPLFGAGLGTTYSFSSIASLLASLGISGILMIAYAFYKNVITVFKMNDKIMGGFIVLSFILIFTIFGSGINNLVFSELLFLSMLYPIITEGRREKWS